MAKSQHIDIEDLKTETPKPHMFASDADAWNFLIEKIDTLEEKIAKLEAEVKRT